MDIIIKNFDDRICIIEFQSTKLTLDDIRRFGNYMASLVQKENMNVQLYVVTMVNEKTKKITKNYGDYGFTIHIISLTDFNNKKVLNKIKHKIKNNEEFKEEDIVLVELLPFMTRKKKKRRNLLKKAAKLTNKLDGRIKSNKIIEIKIIQFLLASEILNDNEKRKIAKVITMKTEEKEEIFQGYLTKEEQEEFYKQGKEEGIKEGKEEGIKEGKEEGMKEGKEEGKEEGKYEEKEEIAKKLIKIGDSPEKISKVTNLSLTEIAALTTII